MGSRAPNRRLLDMTAEPVGPSVRAVYSLLPSANAAVLEAFAAAHRNYDVFVAHDLTAGNAALLRAYRISAVLHHDLRAAARQACLAILQAHGALPGPIRTEPVPVQVLTPVHLPAA
jgi:LacI family transcriptional regulator